MRTRPQRSRRQACSASTAGRQSFAASCGSARTARSLRGVSMLAAAWHAAWTARAQPRSATFGSDSIAARLTVSRGCRRKSSSPSTAHGSPRSAVLPVRLRVSAVTRGSCRAAVANSSVVFTATTWSSRGSRGPRWGSRGPLAPCSARSAPRVAASSSSEAVPHLRTRQASGCPRPSEILRRSSATVSPPLASSSSWGSPQPPRTETLREAWRWPRLAATARHLCRCRKATTALAAASKPPRRSLTSDMARRRRSARALAGLLSRA
mmetsp:Transcript_66315/g.194483  ORF Transcript_66315/g.194483 Transcript_66315/m.194483 type:complete len:266 (-) Transcript_66315:7-804(-)